MLKKNCWFYSRLFIWIEMIVNYIIMLVVVALEIHRILFYQLYVLYQLNPVTKNAIPVKFVVLKGLIDLI